MTNVEQAFLSLLRAGIRTGKPDDPELSREEWETLLKLAEAHKLLPLVLDQAWSLPSCRAALRPVGAPVAAHSVRHVPPVSEGRADCPRYSQREPGGQIARATEQREPGGQIARATDASPDWKAAVFDQVGRQALQENDFLNLILFLQRRGLDPVVLKGPFCRALYPKPWTRPSVDDDLWIPREQAEAYHAAMLAYGMTPDDPCPDPGTSWNIEYHKPGSPLFVETNQYLFDPDSEAVRCFNDPFEKARERAISRFVQDVSVKTPAPEDHLLYLILHAFKHFLYSGFGIRIVTDICLFSLAHKDEVDFYRLFSHCRERRCERFTAAVYQIGEKYLELPAPRPFAETQVDEEALLKDILCAGLHGETIDRIHSSVMTMQAAADRNREKTGGLRRSLFPSASQLKGRFPYLETRPWLLPVAWVSRMWSYGRNRKRFGSQSPVASLRIGRERVRLLKQYGVIRDR